MPRPSFADAIRFLRCERGAMAVEWVILAAGVTGMGLLALNSHRDSLGGFWYRINGEVSSVDTRSDFEDGTDGWTGSGAHSTDIPGFGRALGPIDGSGGVATVSRDFEITKGRTSTEITLDLYGLDSLDGEDAVFYVNGVEVGRIRGTSGTTETFAGTVDGVTFEGRLIDGGRNIGGYLNTGRQWDNDSITEVKIKVDNPGDVVTVGVGSTANQRVSDESWAIDNVRVTGTKAKTPPA